MENSTTASLGPVEEDPESWEVADVDDSMRRLMLSAINDSNTNDNNHQAETAEDLGVGVISGSGFGMSDTSMNTVDQFLLEALQNPRERLSVLRMEQDVEKFIRDPARDQMEFNQLPTSYLRLAAHRIAQHYSLQSMVLLDNSFPDGSGSKIIVRKTSNIRLPLVRLADIPVNLPSEESGSVKVAIKRRQEKGSQSINSSNASKSNGSKSVEERKEEYNRARARIFNSKSSSGSSSGKPEPRIQDSFQHISPGIAKSEEIIFPVGGSDVNIARSLSDSSMVSGRLTRTKTEEGPIGQAKTNSRVAIFRDREIDRKDPDYDRSYDRYMQRFDPGFGFSGGSYTIQPMYAPAINYNTEFPQLGAGQRPPMSYEHQPRSYLQHLPGQWTSPSAPAGVGYGRTETMLSPFSPGPVNVHANSGLFLHTVPYPQRSGLPYIHPLDPAHQAFSQSHQQQPDASYGLARPR